MRNFKNSLLFLCLKFSNKPLFLHSETLICLYKSTQSPPNNHTLQMAKQNAKICEIYEKIVKKRSGISLDL